MLGQIPDDLPTPYTENPYGPGLPPMGGGLGGYGPSPMMGPPFNPDAGFHPINFPQPSPVGLQSPTGPIGMPEQRNGMYMCIYMYIHVLYIHVHVHVHVCV